MEVSKRIILSIFIAQLVSAQTLIERIISEESHTNNSSLEQINLNESSTVKTAEDITSETESDIMNTVHLLESAIKNLTQSAMESSTEPQSTTKLPNMNSTEGSTIVTSTQNSSGNSFTPISIISPSSTVIINITLPDDDVQTKTATDELIPPAEVNASIAQMHTKPRSSVIISSEVDCPSLIDAESLSQTQLIKRLTHGCRYDRLERPITYDKHGERLPVKVFARAYIYFLQNLEAHDLQFKIHALLQLRFVDPRLVFREVAPNRKQAILGENLRSALWVPHIFFSNERDSSILGTDQKDSLTSIGPDGTVIISTRLQATLYCWMDLQKFPFDEQKCTTSLESWMYNTSELVLHWETKSAVTLAPKLHLTEYILMNYWVNESTINADLSDLRHGAFGNYSSLGFTVQLAREKGFYLMDYFLPSMMIVAISWVSFWLQADQSAPRIMLGTSTMLTFITLASAQGKTLPKVSYIKVSEIWFLGCTGFIFGSLVEFAFVNTIWRRKKNVELKKVNSKYILKSTLTPRPARKEMGLQKSKSCSSLNGASNEQNGPTYNNYLTVHSFSTGIPIIKTESVGDIVNENGSIQINMEPIPRLAPTPTPQQETANYGWTTMTPQEISMWIDRRARFLFPCAFIVFNAFFWTFVYCL